MSTMLVYVRPISRAEDDWRSLVDRLEQDPEIGELDVRTWPPDADDAPGRWTTRPGGLLPYAAGLAAAIDSWYEHADRTPDRIVLVGVSLGSTLVRAGWLAGAGALPEVAGGDRSQPWAAAVERIVLGAGVNRGFMPHRGGGLEQVGLRTVTAVAGRIPNLVWKDVLAGSDFLVNLRLRWMQHNAAVARAGTHDQLPLVVQLVGSGDPYVTPGDSDDVVGSGRSVQRVVAGAHHGDVLSLETHDPEVRYRVLRQGLVGDLEPEPNIEPPSDAPTDLVFVVHGIRAGAYGWVKGIRGRLDDIDTDADGKPVRVSVRDGGYSWLSAIEFAVGPLRRRKVRWFLDRYAEEYAQLPDTRFHFAGHSNGTYLLGRALDRVPAVRFDRVYLAASVLPIEFGWREAFRRGQVRHVRSDRADRDVPVALLARGLPGGDIGAGGFEGFIELDGDATTQWPWVRGGHGEMVKGDERLDSIARYLQGGTPQQPDGLAERAVGWLATTSRAAGLVLVLAAVLVLGILVGLAVLVHWAAALFVAVLGVVVLYVV